MESGVACLGPPVNMYAVYWDSFISSLEFGLESTKKGKNLEFIVEKYKDKKFCNFIKEKQEIESFLDCIEEENERIIKFYKNKREDCELESKEVYDGLSYLNVRSKIMDYAKKSEGKDSEKFYCKLIADLKFATQIILGKEKGPLGNYAKSFEDVVNYLKYNRPITWKEKFDNRGYCW